MYTRFKNIKNMKFSKLFVVDFAGFEKNGAMWHCICDCGKNGTYNSKYLRNGDTKSCGCIQGYSNITHGKSYTKIYWIWNEMLRRCEVKNNKKYPSYGARGIKVSDEWHDFNKFYEDMGDPPFGMSLDRINNDGDYCKENCRWADGITQANNTRRNKKSGSICK